MNPFNPSSLKNVLGILCVISGVGTLVGCKEFGGDIQFHSPVLFRSEKGEQMVQPGRYDVTVDFPKKERVRLTLADKVKKGVPQAYIRIPKEYGFPSFYGKIHIPAGENRQQFDLTGELNTEVDDGPESESIESCSEYVPERVCERDAEGRRSCRTESRLVYGDELVRSFNRTTRKILDLDLVDPSTQKLLGELSGTNVDYDKIVTYRSGCHIERRHHDHWDDDRDGGRWDGGR